MTLSRTSSRNRGAVLALVLCMLLIVGSVASVVLVVMGSRSVSVDTLEARLEASRIGRGYSDLLRSAAFDAAATDTNASATPTLPTSLSSWTVTSTSVNGAFDSTMLSKLRSAVGGADRDLGLPGTLPWLVPFSEALRAQGTVRLSRDTSAGNGTVTLDVPVESTLWRIPAATVRLTVSSVTPVFNFPVVAQGMAVIIPETDTSALASFSGTVVQRSRHLSLTAGADPASRITSVYGLNGPAPGFERVLDTTEDPPAGVTTVVIGGVTFLGMDLKSYNGPSCLTIRGAAVSNGFVLIGNPDPSGLASQPLSIAVDGPLILVGSNNRYVFAATSKKDVRLYSSATYDVASQAWQVPIANATDMTWVGHVFVAAVDFDLRADENWSGHTFTLCGSLHVLGGQLSIVGANADTLRSTGITITEPPWTAIANGNPFTAPLRHESFIACVLD